MRNLITDVAGLSVGNAHNPNVSSGVTVAVFDEPAVASVAIHGGAPGVCDTALLEPEASVEKVDALFLSGGSAFGLSAGGGVLSYLREKGRGFQVGNIHVPIAPGAVLFDLAQSGANNWSGIPPWWELGYRAAAAAEDRFDLGTAGAGFGATTANVKGGLGSSSATTSAGFTVGALVAVNAVGSVLIGEGPHFWAGPDELGNEFGGLGSPAHLPSTAFDMAIKGDGNPRANTTIAMTATDALLTKAQARRVAIMAHDGLARAIRPSHAPMDGDLIFAAATGKANAPDLRQLSDIGFVAARCMARAVAIGIYQATTLPGRLPAYRDRFRP